MKQNKKLPVLLNLIQKTGDKQDVEKDGFHTCAWCDTELGFGSTYYGLEFTKCIVEPPDPKGNKAFSFQTSLIGIEEIVVFCEDCYQDMGTLLSNLLTCKGD